MFELPEYLTLASQMNQTLRGKTIREGKLGNSPHKFVWYNRTPTEFARLTKGKIAGEARAKGRWLFVPLDPNYVLVLGECGGKVLYHPAGAELPAKYHLAITFDDGSSLTVMTTMWGAMELFEQGKELERQYIKDMRPVPNEPAFTFEYFDGLINTVCNVEKKSAKGLLTQDQLIPGLGNAIAQDILFRAHLHPKHSIEELTKSERRKLYQAILKTVKLATAKGGRYDEVDLFDHPGGYIRLMDKNSAGCPCPDCGRPIEKLQYLGGACYLCPHCQS